MSKQLWKRVGTSIVAISVALGAAHVPTAAARDGGFTPEIVDKYQSMAKVPKVADQSATSFTVKFQNTDLITEQVKIDELDRLVRDFNTDSGMSVDWTKRREMWNGTWVIDLSETVPANKVVNLRAVLEASAKISHADINARYAGFAAATDPDYGKQWPLHPNTNAPAGSHANVEKAWDLGFTGKDVMVGVSDSGIINHPEMPTSLTQHQQNPWSTPTGNPQDKLTLGIDMISHPGVSGDQMFTDQFNDRDLNPYDDGDWFPPGYDVCPGAPGSPSSSWHGTHVAGIIAANQNNGQGGTGVAPDAKLMMARSLGKCGGDTGDIADAIAWLGGVPVPGVPDNPTPAKVINLSLGGIYRAPMCDPQYQEVINAVTARGTTIMVAAGNATEDTSYTTPANCNNVVTIGSTGPEGHRAMYSNFGDAIDLGAPGGNGAAVVNGNQVQWIPENQYWSTVDAGSRNPIGAGYNWMEGTSMATPLATGVVAMMYEANPSISPADVERILKDTAQPYTEEPYIADNFGFFPDGRPMYETSRTASQMGSGVIDACAAVYQAAVEGGNTPAVDCEGIASTSTPETTEPGATETVTTTVTQAPETVTETATVTEAPVTETDTVTETASPETETSIVTSTLEVTTTAVEPGEVITVTETSTETQAPSTVTSTVATDTATETTTVQGEPTTVVTTMPGATEVVTTTESAPAATETVTETTTAPTATETVTETETAATATVIETIEKEVPGETVTATETTTTTVAGEGVTEVVTETETETTEVEVPVTETVTDASETVVVTTTPAPKHVATVSANWWPALLAIPVALAAALAMPGVKDMFAPFTGDIEKANIRLQKQLGIFDAEGAKSAKVGSSKAKPEFIAAGSSLINFGLILSSLVFDIDKVFSKE
ncbi:S8 family serine peptidase [Corynebacterium incognita]|uniref:S8 family serine peptidase n=1 Tax=Corynebacterium incognita TaxID=2754725 RepID=A0A7G7CMS3_9CORY|nr:S8 family serine peptidase [Corynebacterium incognita]QNE88889.1 S8 family serine peptidase [Corynebacterium incognita]